MLVEALRAVDDLQVALDAQRREIEHLRQAMSAAPATRNPPPPTPPAPGPPRAAPSTPASDRRSMLKHVGMSAAGVLAASAAASVATAAPAAAGDTDPIIIGGGNVAATQTRLHVNGTTAIYGLGVDDNNMSQSMAVEPAIVGHAKGENFTAGLYGRAEPGAIGVYATSVDFSSIVAISTNSKGGAFQGGQAALRLVPVNPTAPPSRANQHDRGELEIDTSGALWWCHTGGMPGQWTKVAGPDTAGALHVLGTTTRVYDSRGGAVPLGGVKGILGPGVERVIDAKNNGSGVPAGAVAVMVNLTVTNTSSGGFCSLFPNGTVWPKTSSINWGLPNPSIANTTLVQVDAAGQFKVRCEGTADVIVDVIAYYR
jgi:hypothetical protein